MKFQLLRILTFLSLAMVAEPDAHWKKDLSKGAMVKAVRERSKDGSTWAKHRRFLFTFQYSFSTSDSDSQSPINSHETLFFLEGDLEEGKNMTLQFRDNHPNITFLSKEEADKIPFSIENFKQILHHYSVQPDSNEAKAMHDTLEDCESPPIEGEEKYCATSMESMTNFSTSELGERIQPICTVVRGESDLELQEYTILQVKKTEGQEYVVCHIMDYPYAVFYCHKMSNVEAYVVLMEGVKKTKAMAVAVCHKNTSAWNPRHLAFQVLNVKPGSVPICHILPRDDTIFVHVPNGNHVAMACTRLIPARYTGRSGPHSIQKNCPLMPHGPDPPMWRAGIGWCP